MRILVCSQEAPLPPLNGMRLQLRSLVLELARSHDLRILAFRAPDQEGPLDPALPPMRLLPLPRMSTAAKAPSLPLAVLARRPLVVTRLAALLRRPLREELASFAPEVVHVTPGELGLLGRQLAGVPSVIAPLDAWYLNVEADMQVTGAVRRRLLRGEAFRVRRFEGTQFARFGAVVVVSEGDREALAALNPSLPIEVVPNGVDAELFAPMPQVPREPGRITFSGTMGYSPNVRAAEFLASQVFPVVRANREDARVFLVGRDPDPRVRALASRPGVIVTGQVEDMRPWLSASRAYACPMLTGTGIKNKLLEAMANGLACVATPLALRGTAVLPGRHALVAEDADGLAGRLIRLLEDDGLARSIGEAARAYVLGSHGWTAAAAGYERIYARVAARAPAAG